MIPVFSDGYMRRFTPDGAIPQDLRAIPDLTLGLPSSTGFHHAGLGTEVSPPQFSLGYQSFAHQSHHPAFATRNVTPQLSSPSVRDFACDERWPPIVIYCPPVKKASGRGRYQRACAIKIEGMWIDKEALYTGTGQGNGMISVHKCQWAKYSNPCGMWIIGSKSHVGAHIRRWHRQAHTEDSKTNCLWDGCTTNKVMLKDSISRHIVSVHLGEAFDCQGCPKVFPRRDVYDKHLEDNGACREVGAVIVYGMEHKVIDTRRALKQEGNEVRYVD